MESKKLFFYELEGRGYTFQNKNWDEAKHGFEDDMLNMAWEMWSSGQAAKAQAVPEWISVKDQLPPEGTEVLVHSLGQVQQATRDSSWSGGFKVRNCYGWQAAYGQSHWMPKSIKLPESFNFYYENDAKNKAMIEAKEQSND